MAPNHMRGLFDVGHGGEVAAVNGLVEHFGVFAIRSYTSRGPPGNGMWCPTIG